MPILPAVADRRNGVFFFRVEYRDLGTYSPYGELHQEHKDTWDLDPLNRGCGYLSAQKCADREFCRTYRLCVISGWSRTLIVISRTSYSEKAVMRLR